VSIWKGLENRLRRVGRAILQSEGHLDAIKHAGGRSSERLEIVAAKLGGIETHLAFLAALEARRELVKIMADPRFDDPLRLERCGFGIHSQYDEDGIIAEIFRRIGATSRTFVEFGAGIGTENCTGFLLVQGWRGLWIEGREDFPFFANHTWGPEIKRGQLVIRNEFVTVDTIDATIGGAGFSGEIDFLAVDLDGNDYHILERISVVAPRVICAEYNGLFPPHVAWAMPRDDGFMWEGIDYRTGASLKALELLLSDRGYALVGCSVAGVNAFFVRKDLTQGKFAEPFTAENHYNPWRFFYAGSASKSTWRGWRT
jgi:hypothetical protein